MARRMLRTALLATVAAAGAPSLSGAVAGVALPECPGADAHTRSESVKGAKPQSVAFANDHGKPVQLFWVDGGGSEVYMDELAAGQERTYSSYQGHAWRAKAHEVGAAHSGSAEPSMVPVIDVVVPPLGSGDVKFTVPRCGTPSQAALPVKVFAAEDREQLLGRRFPDCEAQLYLGAKAVAGFHVLCTSATADEVAVMRSTTDDVLVVRVPPEARGSTTALRQGLERTLELPDPWVRTFMGKKLTKSYHRPFWTLFTPDGRYEMTAWEHMVPNAVNPSGTSFLFEGGVFIWPGVEVGHQFAVEVGDSTGVRRNVTLETLELSPLVFSIAGLFEDWECDHLQNIAAPHIAPSAVNLMDNDIGKADTEWRTSKTHFINRGTDEVVKDLERRVRDVTNIPISYGEGAQILKYEKGQHYHTHHDFFEVRQYSKSQRTLEMTEYGASNRMATVFWYLSTVSEGGETNFPRAGGAGRPSRSDKCYTGLKVKPVKGRVIIFYDMLANGLTDEYSLHAGCDVECEGCVKWSANKWLWNKDQGGRGWVGDSRDRRKDSHAWPDADEVAAIVQERQRGGRSKDDL